MSVRNDECLSKILLQLKFQAIILKDYWPLRGPVRSHVFFLLSLSLRVQYSSSLERTIGSFFLAYLKVLTQTDYPLHTSLIKLISIIVRPGGGWFEAIVFPHNDLLILCISVFCGHRKSIFLAASKAARKATWAPGAGTFTRPLQTKPSAFMSQHLLWMTCKKKQCTICKQFMWLEHINNQN